MLVEWFLPTYLPGLVLNNERAGAALAVVRGLGRHYDEANMTKKNYE